MKINVDEITEIEPQSEMRAPSTLNITVSLSPGQGRKLFYQLWEYFGDDHFSEWLNQEGYEKLQKTETLY